MIIIHYLSIYGKPTIKTILFFGSFYLEFSKFFIALTGIRGILGNYEHDIATQKLDFYL